MPEAAVARPPKILGLLGNEVRWRLVSALARTDRRVKELVDEVAEPQNLVSYHLGLLKRSELVSERRSSLDGRDIYYHLNLDRLDSKLDGAAATLHPSLRNSLASVRPGGRSRKGPTRVRVLFICSGNSARSLMAEAVLRGMSGGSVEVWSAGPAPGGVNPLALEILTQQKIPTAGLRSKSIDEVIHMDFDYVISLCDVAREECPPLSGKPEYMHWSLPDPAAVSGSLERRRTAFRSTVNELRTRIRHLVRLLGTADMPATKSLIGGKAHV